MTVTLIKPSFSAGELSPSLWGRVDQASWHVGATVMRNFFVSYRGPASSRAGMAWVGQSLTSASPSSLPPKIIRFQFNIFQSYILEFGVTAGGKPYMRVIANGGYVTDAPVAITGITQANPAVVDAPGHGYQNGDWVFISGVAGMTQVNQRTFVVGSVTANTFALFDTFGNSINSLAYGAWSSGGTAARIFTNYDTPYALADLPYLKVVQSADVMSLTCVNQQTGSEYPPIDLSRLAANNWNFVPTTFASAIAAPTGCTVTTSVTPADFLYAGFTGGIAGTTLTISAVTTGSLAAGYWIAGAGIPFGTLITGYGTGTGLDGTYTLNNSLTIGGGTPMTAHGPPTQYAYCVTAVDSVTGEESVASNIAYITNSDDIAIVAGSHTITWNSVIGAAYYNIYQAPPAYDTPVPVGSVFGYIGTAYGNQFVNTNIQADLATTPPLHLDPFAPSTILSVGTIPQPGNFNQATTTATINSATGSGGIVIPVVVLGNVVAGIIQNGGLNYATTDTVTFTDSSTSATATAPLNIGPATGTYPAVANYFQARRVYANTLNNPDTVYGSQTGAYQNFDASQPPVDDDSITTTPWGQQVNGIQWMQPMPGGLILGTGLDAWQLSGATGAGSTWTPASQSAQPQESNGFSAIVPPLRINYDIVYDQSYGYVVRDLQYNFFVNIYAGTDVSILSNHLFDGFTVLQWAWAKVPWKIVWATRNDGKFLSLTFDKEEALKGWARHDTNGLVVGNEVATEPPVDAPYFVVKRFIIGRNRWAYYIERMDNRLWNGPEDPWCVDSGLSLVMPTPDATLSAASAIGPGTISGGYLPNGGQNYSNPSAQINDPLNTGSGGAISFTVTAGVITAFTIVSAGQDYSPGTTVDIADATGAGATFVPLISQNVLFNASAAVFAGNQPGDVIRVGGGQATVITVNSATQVLAAIVAPILQTMPDDPNRLPIPAPSGSWSITTPVSSVSNLDHLEGMQVTGLADGEVIPLTTVVNGSIALAQPASNIKIGLPYICQLQSMPTEIPALGSIQGERKRIPGATIRVQASRGFQLAANQPIASALDYQPEIPWDNLVDPPSVPRSNVPAAALPLFTGDLFAPINDDWQNWNGWEASPGCIAAQQLSPNPLDVLAFVPRLALGDNKGEQ